MVIGELSTKKLPLEDILSAVQSDVDEAVLWPFRFGGEEQNELLFFFKPECFLEKTIDEVATIIATAAEKFEHFAVNVSGVYMVSGPRLKDQGIMDRHYGFINEVSRGASTVLREEEQAALRTASMVGPDTRVLGGHELLKDVEDLNEAGLEDLWASKKSKKMRSGLYFESYEIKGETLVLVNGFHPAQIRHFTDSDRRLVVILLRSEMPWKVLRQFMLGDTFPERAAEGSFRRTLYQTPGRYGFQEVSIANNASHLSAGPFEAMFEQVNFLSSSGVADFDVEETRMWKQSRTCGVSDAEIRETLSNPSVPVEGVERSLFDLTEEVDSLAASNLLRVFWSRRHLESQA